MKWLLILRHGKSSWKDPELDDSARPLNGRGRRAALRMGRLLQDEGIVPDRVFCSTALRARDTAILALGACGFDREIEFLPELYFAGVAAADQRIAELPASVCRLLVVGHNPDLEVLVERLTGATVHLPTAGLAAIELPISRWQELEGVQGALRELWVPKELEDRST